MNRYSILIFLITIILFSFPFFWLKPGEMDLGGDSSRLYFYDPGSFLVNQVSFGFNPTEKGGESVIAYALLPYVSLLLFIKKIINSPTILISIFNGINTGVAFLFVCLTVKEFLKSEKITSEFKITVAAILAGLVYVFSPYNTLGWDKVIFTRNQIFLNPLMFYLLLKYIISQKRAYILVFLVLTFIFSFNFSYIGAPPFFAFYPLSFSFLFLYTKYVLKKNIPIKDLFIYIIIFICIQAFHLVPSILGLFSTDSSLQKAVISDQAILSRGRDYFLAVAPNLKVSISFLNLSQGEKINFLHFFFVIFPLSLLFGLFLSTKKTIFLTTIFFLIALFFATANITNVGFTFYEYLFYIPGFAMFRSVDGQWGFVFLFFYSILLGLAWGIIFSKIKNIAVYLFTLYTVGFLVISALPFINGNTIRRTLHQTKGIKPVIRMDPLYEKTLDFIGNIGSDVKLLSFPLVDGGYQVLQGANGGVYMGPPIASYLKGKHDFTSYDSLSPFNEQFIKALNEKDISLITPMLSVLNIGYIFHNSDPYIYDSTFKGYPYNYVRNYLPKTQKEYEKFIQTFPIELNEKINFGEKYHLYPLKKDFVFPHLFTTTNNIYSNDPESFLFSSQLHYATRSAVYSSLIHSNKDAVVLSVKVDSPFSDIKNNYHLHKHEPFISFRLSNILYPFVILKEKLNLLRNSNNHDSFFDFNLFYLSKRILELNMWSKDIPVLRIKWIEPKIWDVRKWRSYNSWEANLTRYENGMEKLIDWMNVTTVFRTKLESDKIKINEQIDQHRVILIKILESMENSDDKEYLEEYINKMFTRINKKLHINKQDVSKISYKLEIPKNFTGGGEYEIFMSDPNFSNVDLQQAYFDIKGRTIKMQEFNEKNNQIKFGKLYIDNKKDSINFTIHISPKLIVQDNNWVSSGMIQSASDSSRLLMKNTLNDNSGGLLKEINNWLPNKQYHITFDYNTFGENVTFKLHERSSENSKFMFFSKNINSKEWTTHQSIVTSNTNAKNAYIQFLPNNNRNAVNVQLRNLQVIELSSPKVFFVKDSTDESVPPKIIFTKINPTKYKIKVMNVTSPYTLIFLESFDKNWRLRNPLKQGNQIWKLLIVKCFTTIGSLAEKVLLIVGNDRKIIASYFEGSVLETEHANIFLDSHTFETVEKQVVADDRHFLVNAYANGWNIKLDDLDGKTNYELILELKTQNIFYISLFLSFCFVIGCVLFLSKDLFNTIQKIWKNRFKTKI